jgi:hypothetical protein
MFSFLNCGRTQTINVLGDVPVFTLPYPDFYKEKDNSLLTILKAGETATLVSIVDGKDYRAYEIGFNQNQKGYIISGGNFEIK